MKMSIGAVALVALGAVVATPLVGAAQEAELSANVGLVSEYFFRGITQKGEGGAATSEGASASAGLDVAFPNVYLGTWAADVGDGNEVDLYAGVGTEVDDFSVSIGGTAYLYTDSLFDGTFLEGNLNAGYKALSAEFTYGRHDLQPTNTNYWFLAGTLEQWGLYGTIGLWGDNTAAADPANFDGAYFEAGYGVTVADLDLSASWVYSTDKLLETTLGLDPMDNNLEHTLVFGIGYTFDIDIN